jgi:phage repressor protein C with HTH and peptisase S24 domain
MARKEVANDVSPEVAEIFRELDERDINQADMARAIGIDPSYVSKMRTGVRKMRSHELIAARKFLKANGVPVSSGELSEPAEDLAYVEVKVLPSYAGMGGGGSGEGDRVVAKLPRRLIEDELRGRASDFELIDVRGDSMEPDFQHGDQILIDRRDRDPRQPGPFALWDDDGYVVKLVERVPQRRGWYRIFSANSRYSAYEVEETETTILGRPVWFARRL